MHARDTVQRPAAPRSWRGGPAPMVGPRRVTSRPSGSPPHRGTGGATSMVVAGRPEATPTTAAARAITMAAGGLRAVTTRAGPPVANPMVAAAPRAVTTVVAARLPAITAGASGHPVETPAEAVVHPVVEAVSVVGGAVGVVAGVAEVVRRRWAAVGGAAECERRKKSPRKVRGLFSRPMFRAGAAWHNRGPIPSARRCGVRRASPDRWRRLPPARGPA
jgi:hypothetical protein